MKCALCLREETLCDSHIIPEFLYTTLYDDKHHRFHAISLDSKKRDKQHQKGIRQKLLCVSCEQALSEPESYVSKLLNGGMLLSGHREENRLHLSGLNYKQLKLFQLSILWRASVSSLSEFSEVKLGPHEETIRLMLRTSNGGLAEEFGCIMSVITHDSKPLTGLVVPPTRARFAGHRAYRFVFGGMGFVYVVTRTHLPAALKAAFTQENGDTVVRLQPVTEMGYLMDTFGKLNALGKLDNDA